MINYKNDITQISTRSKEHKLLREEEIEKVSM